jgi:hypothetical protein
LSKQYPFDNEPLVRNLRFALRAGCIGGPQARYKTLRESLTEAVQAPLRWAAKLLHGEAYGATEDGTLVETGAGTPEGGGPTKVAVGLLISGAYYFRRMEKTFADVV